VDKFLLFIDAFPKETVICVSNFIISNNYNIPVQQRNLQYKISIEPLFESERFVEFPSGEFLFLFHSSFIFLLI